MRITVRAKPGAAREKVGGRHGEPTQGEPDVLVVAVGARAVDGAANEAVVAAVACAFGVRPRHVTLVSGSRARTKILDIDDEALGGTAEAQRTLSRLLGP